MKVALLNFSDNQGGAARAAYRIHKSLITCSADSIFYVNEKHTDDWSVVGPTKLVDRLILQAKRRVGIAASKLLKTNNSVLHSPAIMPSRWKSILDRDGIDIVHLQWVASEMLSVRAIGKITKPIVWTLHDMWAFCGAEHYTDCERYVEGYTKYNRPKYERGFDLNRWVWTRKLRNWKSSMNIVTPSNWLAECARKSYLLGSHDISVIPNPIDVRFWRPFEKSVARKLLSLPTDKKLILFAAADGVNDPRKGFDLLLMSLNRFRENATELSKNIELVVSGQSKPKASSDIDLGFNVNYLGRLHDDLTMMLAYNAADILVIPSRMDNLPNTGVEALSTGTPILAFNVCGLPDLVVHQKTGYLAKPFDSDELAMGIYWLLQDENRIEKLGNAAREFAEKNFSYKIVGERYLSLYKNLLHSVS